ncbi:hypothetical protein PCANC_24172 [Puccinia coronata f. sp. avenae]|uniref:Polyadenylation factor subunit 2 n=1 Tax=Puccinia coronata f. sp. avenae TaxID=200324 RepID=A0A2N5S575_9BASI|nr:hypothetical protein PCANC_24172 [Puccinia coronata f. sp. avenae]
MLRCHRRVISRGSSRRAPKFSRNRSFCPFEPQRTVTKTMETRNNMQPEQPASGNKHLQALEPTSQQPVSSPIASTSSARKAATTGPVDLRPHMGRKQAWDAWRPGPYGRPTPPSMEKRLAEESALEMAAMMGHGRQDGRARKIRPRRTVDVGGSMCRWTLMRSLKTCPDEHYFIRPCIDHLIEFLPPQAYSTNPSTSIMTKYVHTSTNKIRCPINIVRFTPDARRELTGATSGEFTLWNALTFNFEMILQAHDTAVRALDWSKSGAWLVSGDNNGIIKYFQPNMNNLQMFEGHKDSIRDIGFSPNDSRFASCGDDGVIKLWGFEERREERSFTGPQCILCTLFSAYASRLDDGLLTLDRREPYGRQC